MSRHNLLVIATVALISGTCYARAERNRHGRYLSQVLEAVDRWALEPVEQQTLFDSAMQGIVEQLDEYSTYISANDMELFEAELEQEFGGIGVVMRQEGEDKQLTVVSPPLLGTPAQRAGIRVRDRIVSIDGTSTIGMTMEQIVRRMRGVQGEPIRLAVLHENSTEPTELSMVRETIKKPSVLGDRRHPDGSWDFLFHDDQRIAYIRITSFGEKTVDELEFALERIKQGGARALILDLRDNSGGLLPAAVATCDLFLPQDKTIVSIRGRERHLEKVFTSSGRGMYLDLPMVVLANRYSASASEIVAACLQDHQRAVVVGEPTWGKGTVQHAIPIESGRSILKLTAASYWRPSGKNIHRLKDALDGEWGVIPDPHFNVSVTDEERLKLREQQSEWDVNFGPAKGTSDPTGLERLPDRQLTQAIEYLREIVAEMPQRKVVNAAYWISGSSSVSNRKEMIFQ